VPSDTLRAYVSVLNRRGLRWLFADQVADIRNELLARELPSIADESDGYLVDRIVGEQ
jgi:hypothetical protein